jgi:hypothetical protein
MCASDMVWCSGDEESTDRFGEYLEEKDIAGMGA